MSKCQMNKYRAGGRCSGSAQPGSNSNASVISGAMANLMATREQQDRVFAPEAMTIPAKQQALVKQVAPPRPEKKECIDIILNGYF
jgi:hypothetical protein